MRSWKLKARIAGLVLESRHVRVKVEYVALSATQELSLRQKLAAGRIPKNHIQKYIERAKQRPIAASTYKALIGVATQTNVMLDAPPAPMIEDSEARYYDAHYHRTVTLRRELRASNLAYGFLLDSDRTAGILRHGITNMEWHDDDHVGSEPVPIERIREIAAHYAGDKFDEAAFAGWCSEIDPAKYPEPHRKPTETELRTKLVAKGVPADQIEAIVAREIGENGRVE
jgi:hypothetical protein